MNSTALRITLVALLLLAATAGLTLWNPEGNRWGTVEPPKAQAEAYDSARLAGTKTLDASIYDPRKLARLVREPQNTASNAAYMIVGLAIAFAAQRRASRSLAVACLFLGVGSGLYHASLLPEWRMLDILGVYAVLFALMVVGSYAVMRLQRFEFPAVCASWITAFYAGIHRNDVRIAGFKILDSKVVVPVCVVCGSVMALWMFVHARNRRRYACLAAMLATTAGIAFFAGLEDRFGGIWARPEATIQGHSVWHCLGACALLIAYEIFSLGGFDRSAVEVFALQSDREGGSSGPPGSAGCSASRWSTSP